MTNKPVKYSGSLFCHASPDLPEGESSLPLGILTEVVWMWKKEYTE